MALFLGFVLLGHGFVSFIPTGSMKGLAVLLAGAGMIWFGMWAERPS